MNRQEKTFWIPYRITEPAALELYFERMAQKGWLPVNIQTYTGLFRRMEPKDCRFCLDFPRLEPGEEAKEEYLAFCKEFGWEYCCCGSGWMLFFTVSPQTVPLQSDPQMAAANFRRDFLRRFWNNLALAAIGASWILFPLFFNKGGYLRKFSCWDSMAELLLGVLALILPLLLLAGAFSSLSSYFESRKAMKERRLPRLVSAKKAIRRVLCRQLAAGVLGAALLSAVCWDIWGGTFRPAIEQWAVIAVGGLVLGGSSYIPGQWKEGIPRRFAVCAGGLFLILGFWLSYPANRREPVAFTADDPVVQATDFLPNGEVETHAAIYGYSPLYEKWQLYQWSQEGEQGIVVSTTSYLAASSAMANLLAEEELAADEALFRGRRRQLDWPGYQCWQVGDTSLVLWKDQAVIRFFPEGSPEKYQGILLETLEELLQNP